ncbi:hypothetical protein Avbf_14113 [Armadillidium vulgare]|nr:hypothetical protein Avbf_14113 [Armadillidium vulgare]
MSKYLGKRNELFREKENEFPIIHRYRFRKEKYYSFYSISWIRTRDLHLLTVGRFTYTSDDRFKAVHLSGSEDWLLKIHYVQMRDQGPYECQVSTTPPISHTVWLNVADIYKTVWSG